jgi:hypothetical protein
MISTTSSQVCRQVWLRILKPVVIGLAFGPLVVGEHHRDQTHRWRLHCSLAAQVQKSQNLVYNLPSHGGKYNPGSDRCSIRWQLMPIPRKIIAALAFGKFACTTSLQRLGQNAAYRRHRLRAVSFGVFFVS